MSKEQKITGNIQPPNKDLEILKKNFPNCFDKKGEFNFEKFKTQLSKNEINFSKESYGMDWLGKSYARLLATDETTTLLKEDDTFNQKDENKNSENLLIKGDNLEVLKHLSNAYYEKVKMIYIDPPYNTGSDGFVYADDRKFTVQELQELAGVSEERAKRILDFTQSKSNSHSAWLTFMYPRLYIAKQLLKDDGVIFISIDDNEVAQLRLLMDEIFGEENFVAEFSRITKKAGKTTDTIAKNTDYLICYGKSSNVSIKKESFIDNKYNNIDSFKGIRGFYKLSQTLDYSSIQYSRSLDYEIEIEGNIFRPGNSTKEEMEERQLANPNSDACWRWSRELFNFGYKNDFIVVKNNRIYTKTYKNATIKKINGNYEVVEVERKKSISTLEFIENKYSNDNAKKNLSKYFKDKIFEYSKPVSLVTKSINITTNKDDLILDFFAGSGTTGDAVMQLNTEDGGNRKFILVQLPELIDPKSSKTTYDFVENELKVEEPTIFDITRERLIRASKKIQEENDLVINDKGLMVNESKDKKIDLGFKVFETMPIWEDYNFESEELEKQTSLFDESKLTKEDIKALLVTWKTYDGIPLSRKLTKTDLNGYTAHYSSEKLYLMGKGFSTRNLKSLLEKIDVDKNFNPTTIIAFGYHFESKNLREIGENIKSYANKKSIDIEFITRY